MGLVEVRITCPGHQDYRKNKIIFEDYRDVYDKFRCICKTGNLGIF